MPKKRRSKKTEPSLFEGIRKPTAPPSRQFDDRRDDQKHYPAGRASKHKKRVTDTQDENGDL